MATPILSGRVRFGVLEVDLGCGELDKERIKIKLHDQPFQVLAMLLEHPGELVTREQLHQKLWPADTFVDFDVGLNSAIKRLRDALGDSAEEPRYIETLPRRGYRFIAPLADRPEQGTPETRGPAEPATELHAAMEAMDSPGSAASPAPAPGARVARIGWVLPGLGVLVVLLFAIMRFATPPAVPPAGAGVNAAPPSKTQPAVGSALLIEHPSANPEANELLQRALIFIRFQYDPRRARPMLERALQLEPNFTEARVYYALTYIIAVEGGLSNDPGDVFRAEAELRRAVKEDPEIALAHAMLGAVHFYQGRLDLAAQALHHTVPLAPPALGGTLWLLVLGRFLRDDEKAPRAAAKSIESHT